MNTLLRYRANRGRNSVKASALPDDHPPTTSSDTSTATAAASASLRSLPPELQWLIARMLIYPDALSLKHTCRHFYYMVDTGVRLKVEWLMERRSLHLECPNDRRCDLGSDLRFCRGSVPLLMKRRREHLECESRPNLGCVVFGTPACAHRSRKSPWPSLRLVDVSAVLLAILLPVVCGWLWLAGLLPLR